MNIPLYPFIIFWILDNLIMLLSIFLMHFSYYYHYLGNTDKQRELPCTGALARCPDYSWSLRVRNSIQVFSVCFMGYEWNPVTDSEYKYWHKLERHRALTKHSLVLCLKISFFFQSESLNQLYSYSGWIKSLFLNSSILLTLIWIMILPERQDTCIPTSWTTKDPNYPIPFQFPYEY